MKFRFQNLPILYQVLAPVILAIVSFIIAIGFTQSKLNLTSENSQLSADTVSYANYMQRSERVVQRYRRAAYEALIGQRAWDNFFAEQDKYTQQLDSLFDSIRNSSVFSDYAKGQLESIEREFASYRAMMVKASKLKAESEKEYASLPWIYEKINNTNELVLASEQAADEKNAWRQARAELFVASTKVQTYFAELMQSYNPESREDLRVAMASFATIIDDLDNSIVDENIGVTYSEYTDAVREVNDINDELYNVTQNAVEVGQSIRQHISELAAYANENAEAASDESLVLIGETSTTLIVALVASSIAAAFVGYICASSIKSTVSELQVVIQAVSRGELFKKSTSDSDNEIGQLCQNTNSTIDSLNSTVGNLRNVGTEVSSSATELASVMTELEANAVEQRSQVELIASAITELATSSTQVAASASSADQNAKAVIAITNQGVESAQNGVHLSDELCQELQQTSDVASSLDELSNNVSSFVSMIENVAEQTNLLALNAAIEAARAGESGRGFAVVADEVRVLAQKTSESTGSIQELVDTLQLRAKDMIQSVDRCVTKVEATAEINRQTSSQLATISDEVAHISMNNSEMSSAADEQSRAISSMNENIATIDEAIAQNATGVTQSAEAAAYLSELSEGQSQQLDFFKLKAS
ncbi:methyl-accepting chemotaxis protein [Vibrio sp. SCSIO 43135]|uniref:methyl-accepting chemotaxis protein n=1 Tax=Vibrio sp. SCSIO 43135 TaxID=2819096 RepID=UPI002074C7B7|nr:methyl-accepting chemotaxis protein [Vibrio sp. SCSIO 43135]USD43522.1 methyl-accepting chemotaxis protein [Vibrio sp. SCSIO 43135]